MGKEEFACFSLMILDDVSSFWAVRGGKDVLTIYLCSVDSDIGSGIINGVR